MKNKNNITDSLFKAQNVMQEKLSLLVDRMEAAKDLEEYDKLVDMLDHQSLALANITHIMPIIIDNIEANNKNRLLN